MRKLLGELLGVVAAIVELTALAAIRHRVNRLSKSVTIAELYAEEIRQRGTRNAPSN